MKLGELELSSSNALRLVGVIVVAVVVLLLRFVVMTPDQAIHYVYRVGYYSLAFCTLVAFCSGLCICRNRGLLSFSRLRPRILLHRWGIVSVLFLSILTHVHEPHRFKVLQDEHALLATSKMMHEHREAVIPAAVQIYNGVSQDGLHYVGKRSLFFQFLLSGLHDLTGFRPANAFILNFIVTVVFYAALYSLVYLLTRDRLWAHVALWMAFSIPLVAHIATSGGYDLLSITMLLIVALIGHLLLRSNGDQALQTFLIYFSLLAVQVRYEAMLYLLPMALIVAIQWLRARRVTVSWLDMLSPLFLILPLMLNLNMTSSANLMDQQFRGDDVAFTGWQYFSPNILSAFEYFFMPSFGKTNSVIISIFCVLGIVSLVVLSLTRCREFFRENANCDRYIVVGFMLFVAVVCFLIVMFNFWGRLMDYQATRFAIALYMWGLLAAILTMNEISVLKGRQKYCLYFFCAVAFCTSIPSSGSHKVTRSMVPSLLSQWYLDFAEEKGRDDNFYIARGCLGLAVNDFACTGSRYANKNPAMLLRLHAHGVYKRFYAVEIFGYNHTNGRYDDDYNNCAISERFIYNVVDELNLRPVAVGRIVEIVGLRLKDGREVLFDSFALPEKQYHSNQEYFRKVWSIFENKPPYDLNLAEYGLELAPGESL